MFEYSFNRTTKELVIIALKIEKALGITPLGLSSGERTMVMFENELTSSQKAQLVELMKNVDIENIPENSGKTTLFIEDVMENRKALSQKLGVPITIYPVKRGYEIHFEKKLNVTQKQSVFSIISNLVQEK